MFYHDHAWGITRLNVYAGEAAGYLDHRRHRAEAHGAGGALEGRAGIPLIIQDKTFVPQAADPARPTQDPTWDKSRWGGEGSLWYHHVYMPAQNPGDPSGMSAFGRWMYGPWFWPPAGDAKYGPIANPYYDPPATSTTRAPGSTTPTRTASRNSSRVLRTSRPGWNSSTTPRSSTVPPTRRSLSSPRPTACAS